MRPIMQAVTADPVSRILYTCPPRQSFPESFCWHCGACFVTESESGHCSAKQKGCTLQFQSRTFLPSWRSRFRDVKDRNELSLCTAVQRRSTAQNLQLHRLCAAAPKNRGIQRLAALTMFPPILNPLFGGFITYLKHPLLRFLELPATLCRSVSTIVMLLV